jgi:glycosyltransferase involved in cell wall biosynthesis
MSLGCPVLASRIPATREVCLDAPLYFEPEEQNSFNRELLRAIDDEAARQQSVRRGTEVANQYSWEKCGQQTLALYRQCQ